MKTFTNTVSQIYKTVLILYEENMSWQHIIYERV